MKFKNIFIICIINLVSILFSFVSCKSSEQIKYKVSKYNDEMNEDFLLWQKIYHHFELLTSNFEFKKKNFQAIKNILFHIITMR